MKCKKSVQNSLSNSLFFFSLSLFLSCRVSSARLASSSITSLLLSPTGSIRPILFSVDILFFFFFFFFYISFSFFWFLRILVLMVLFGRAKECAAFGLITPSKGTGRELRLRNSLWPDFWNSWPRETHHDLPSDLDCFWITDISNCWWRNRRSISSFYRWTMMRRRVILDIVERYKIPVFWTSDLFIQIDFKFRQILSAHSWWN